MFDGDGMRLNLFEEGKGFSYMVVRGGKSLGLKMNLSSPLEEEGMGCSGWQHSAGKSPSRGSWESAFPGCEPAHSAAVV